ncbi:predicted protein [Plenodomus lingam JN3]|uniref:Uncharacterized protein n=1 Tax=Leptosphaeria maculans (strain JN3 / isolate v23.1.3 / race Av1-4-5-6-7-8) TaxID=985895 RepID=E4ZG02_LEPMJ|nr:predicted protein [Plenodomus lingam JN3]CBX90222.1 predicted protein [Plenodomus lingam JN3]
MLGAPARVLVPGGVVHRESEDIVACACRLQQDI